VTQFEVDLPLRLRSRRFAAVLPRRRNFQNESLSGKWVIRRFKLRHRKDASLADLDKRTSPSFRIYGLLPKSESAR
jgi:hypothetical protein